MRGIGGIFFLLIFLPPTFSRLVPAEDKFWNTSHVVPPPIRGQPFKIPLIEGKALKLQCAIRVRKEVKK